CVPAFVEGRGARHLLRLPPGPVDLADHECLAVAGAVYVVAARAAVARRRAGDPADFAERAAWTLVEGREAGHLLRFPPGPVDLADSERPAVEGAVCLEAARAAVARRGAGYPGVRGVPALVEGRGAGHPLCLPPGPACLADHEC